MYVIGYQVRSSEVKQRKLIKKIIPVDILAMFTFNRTGGGFEIRAAAYAQVPDISKLVIWLLDSNQR